MTSPFAEWAWSYIQRGFSVVPILSGAKAPGFDGHLMPGWQRFCKEQPDIELIRGWSSDPLAGIGVCCGYEGVIAVDIDDARSFPAVATVLGGRGAPTKRGLKGATAFFIDAKGEIPACKFSRPGGGHFIEFLGRGNQSVLPPSIHPGDPSKGIPSPGPYKWVKGSMEAMRLSELPPITKDDVDRLEELLAPLMIGTAEEREKREADTKSLKESLANLTKYHEARYRGMAPGYLKGIADNLANKGRPGRSNGAFAAARSIGWAVVAGYLTGAKARADLFAACEKNGLVKENGRKDVLRSIDNGLAQPDPLPDLDSLPDKPEYVAKQQLWQKRQQERREWEERNTRFARIPRNPAFAASEAAQSPL